MWYAEQLLFASDAPRTKILQYVEANIKSIRCMGSFETLQSCKEVCESALRYKNESYIGLITGSVNYVNLEEANDIDLCVFQLGDRFQSNLFEASVEINAGQESKVDILLVTVRRDDKLESDILRILSPKYPTSRYLYNLRNEELKKANIKELKDECKRLGIRSSVIPAFKGFIIALIAAEEEAKPFDLQTCLKKLATLKHVTLSASGCVESILFHKEDDDISSMEQHKLYILDDNKTERFKLNFGNASLRRGITKLLLEKIKNEESNLDLKKFTQKEEFKFNKGLKDVSKDNNNSKIKYVTSVLDTFGHSVVFVTEVEDGFVVHSTTSQTSTKTTTSTPSMNESISFWGMEECDIKNSPQKESQLAKGNRPIVPRRVTSLVGDVTEDESLFALDMVQRFLDEKPLISRRVDDPSLWSGEGLCHCHSNDTLKDKFIVVNPTTMKTYTLTKENEKYFSYYIENWFTITTIPNFETGYTRFTWLIKMIDVYHTNNERREDWYVYSVEEKKIILTEAFQKSINDHVPPNLQTWKVKEFRDGWKQVRDDMSKNTTSKVLTDGTPPTTPKSSTRRL